MYFVHPQFQLKNIPFLISCFFKKPHYDAIFTDMGRTAFKLIIEELGLQKTDIIMPSYTCDIFLPIFEEYSIKPIFVDAEKHTFNMDVSTIEEKLTKNTRSILIAHIYGLKADTEKILAIATKYDLKIIEDCCHALGNKNTGNAGDASFYSLYKLFPCLRGGLAVLQNKDTIRLKETKFNFRDFLSLLNGFPFFSFLFKKYAREQAQKHIRKEKNTSLGGINRISLNIFQREIKNIEKTIEKRKRLSSIYQIELEKLGFECQKQDNNSLTLFSCLCPKNIDRNKFVFEMRKKGVFSTRIWHTPIIIKAKADLNQFPNTIEISKRIINFPLQNFYKERDIRKIIQKTKDCLSSV